MKSPLEMAQRCAHLMGGNGLTVEQSVRLIAQELAEWKADAPADIPARIAAFEGPQKPYTHEELEAIACGQFPRTNDYIPAQR